MKHVVASIYLIGIIASAVYMAGIENAYWIKNDIDFYASKEMSVYYDVDRSYIAFLVGHAIIASSIWPITVPIVHYLFTEQAMGGWSLDTNTPEPIAKFKRARAELIKLRLQMGPPDEYAICYNQATGVYKWKYRDTGTLCLKDYKSREDAIIGAYDQKEFSDSLAVENDTYKEIVTRR